MKQVLVIEDDVTLAEGLCRGLSGTDIEVSFCGTLQEGRQILQEADCPHLILLDVNLPDGSGFDFLKEIRAHCSIPVIMLTANDMESDMVYGLENGAVDYITKPFSLAVLRARVGVQLRQQEMRDKESLCQEHMRETDGIWQEAQEGGVFSLRDDAVVCIDGYRFDFERMEFRNGDNLVELSKTEQKLLRMLVKNQGITLSRSELIDRIWTDGAEYVDENALSVTVKRLRDKLCALDYIKTVYGIGYVWVVDNVGRS